MGISILRGGELLVKDVSTREKVIAALGLPITRAGDEWRQSQADYRKTQDTKLRRRVFQRQMEKGVRVPGAKQRQLGLDYEAKERYKKSRGMTPTQKAFRRGLKVDRPELLGRKAPRY